MASPPRKRNFPRPLGEFIAKAINPVVAKQGFGEADILLHWPQIAGPRLAAVSEPLRLQWPVRPPGRAPDAQPEPASLVLRVEGAFALEFQHVAPLLVERVNARLGWRCIGRVVLKQGPIHRQTTARKKVVPPSAVEQQRAAVVTQGIDDEDLRGALNRLGSRVFQPQRAKT
ncbi:MULTISPECIES: DciA family protein [unclassified Beijerinckia]|uniref:DUF721 domain-containing protein n=1 Tax=unclassified Beijerinckia TaxID=2638183 RepID=UPI000B860B60|nr:MULTISPECIES: DciA family protein [unclassified Beijerinckia]